MCMLCLQDPDDMFSAPTELDIIREVYPK
jgi:hypothetical protein